MKAVSEQFQLLAESKRESFPELHRMLRHTLVGGKVIRPALTLLCCHCFNYEQDKVLPMATASELMHISTLIHDDAIDKADTRRGLATVNALWGTDKAILLGDYLFARAGEFAAATDNIRVVKLFSRTLQIISSGELNQAFDAYSYEQTFGQYTETHRRQDGGFNRNGYRVRSYPRWCFGRRNPDDDRLWLQPGRCLPDSG